jgi:hypothetical protein
LVLTLLSKRAFLGVERFMLDDVNGWHNWRRCCSDRSKGRRRIVTETNGRGAARSMMELD